jgi:hypothetical protein
MAELTPRPSPDVVFKLLDQEAVLVHLGTNRIFTLTATGARFWQLLAGGSDPQAIEQQLLEEYDVPQPELSAEIDSLVRELTAEGLLSRSGDADR